LGPDPRPKEKITNYAAVSQRLKITALVYAKYSNLVKNKIQISLMMAMMMMLIRVAASCQGRVKITKLTDLGNSDCLPVVFVVSLSNPGAHAVPQVMNCTSEMRRWGLHIFDRIPAEISISPSLLEQ
jgi:hypothetical protein